MFAPALRYCFDVLVQAAMLQSCLQSDRQLPPASPYCRDLISSSLTMQVFQVQNAGCPGLQGRQAEHRRSDEGNRSKLLDGAVDAGARFWCCAWKVPLVTRQLGLKVSSCWNDGFNMKAVPEEKCARIRSILGVLASGCHPNLPCCKPSLVP